jgi:F420-non-reducing hydrogenase iron-sulfur subunit
LNDDLQVYLFCCLSSLDSSGLDELSAEFKIIPLPCSGKADILYLTKAFETGADGVAVLMCPEGECRYLEGNLRARKRVEAVDSLLKEAGLGNGRAAVVQLDNGGTAKAVRALREFRKRLNSVVVSAAHVISK